MMRSGPAARMQTRRRRHSEPGASCSPSCVMAPMGRSAAPRRCSRRQASSGTRGGRYRRNPCEVRHRRRRDGRVTSLGDAITLRTVEHASLQTAWEAFGEQLGRALPRAAAIAVACPIMGEILKLTNNPWIIRPAHDWRPARRRPDHSDQRFRRHRLMRWCTSDPEHLRHLCGPDVPLPETGRHHHRRAGTGLGVAHVLRRDGRNHVIECEGGHIDFAPLDDIEDVILARLRQRYRRVSAERIVSGPGSRTSMRRWRRSRAASVQTMDDKALWTAALSGEDSLAAAALDRFCMVLGSVAGDIALAHGANAVVIAGGLGLRIADLLPRSGFASRFTAKGRFEPMMAAIPGQSDYPSPAWSIRRRRRLCRGTQPMNDVESIMRLAPVIPVLVIDDVAYARPIAEALVAGGLCALEVTLRTPVALDAIREMAKVEGAIVGAGTVLNEHDLEASLEAGARFIVSPGLTEP